jgi:hypothetical protein
LLLTTSSCDCLINKWCVLLCVTPPVMQVSQSSASCQPMSHRYYVQQQTVPTPCLCHTLTLYCCSSCTGRAWCTWSYPLHLMTGSAYHHWRCVNWGGGEGAHWGGGGNCQLAAVKCSQAWCAWPYLSHQTTEGGPRGNHLVQAPVMGCTGYSPEERCKLRSCRAPCVCCTCSLILEFDGQNCHHHTSPQHPHHLHHW